MFIRSKCHDITPFVCVVCDLCRSKHVCCSYSFLCILPILYNSILNERTCHIWCLECLDVLVTPSAASSSSDNDEEDTEQVPSSSAEQQVAVKVEQPVPVPVKTPPKTLSKWQPLLSAYTVV